MINAISAFPTTDGIFVFWYVSQMIPDCLGFALIRDVEGEGTSVVETWVGFEDESKAHKQGEHRPSTKWPIQKTSWTDYQAPTIGKVRYGVIPVLKSGTTDVKPAATSPNKWSNYVSVKPDGALNPWFNRGTISAQWLARAIGCDPKPSDTLGKAIATKGNKIRNFLKGALGERLIALLADAKRQQRVVYIALFELSDPELVDSLKGLGPRAHVVLGNGTGKKDDPTEQETEANGGVLEAAKVDIVRRKIAPARFAHNKFAVFLGADGEPETLWTGSTNWTRTGLCTQNNNGLEIRNKKIASDFRERWQLLHDNGDKTPSSLTLAGDRERDHALNSTKVRIWFTPTSKGGDLVAATALIKNCKQGIVCLMLNPGNDGLLGPILEQCEQRDARGNPKFFVRGVLNNFPAQSKDSPKDQLKLLTCEGKYQVFKGEQLRAVTRPAAIDASADWWLRELKNMDTFMIAVHSKVIVIDPSGKHPVVMTGSHNFSKRASTKNDDNLVIIEGDALLAQSYAANVIGIYNTYRWQAWRNTTEGRKDKGIKRNDHWLSNRIGKGWAKIEARFWLGSPPSDAP
jgi:phosphatidylserine/phosphatidylglycerophosphate/cardiolipin synthase-like enzyme